MITQIDLHLFKCFELIRLPLSNLSILAGTNASGKSSILQALALLHQTIRDYEWSIRLMLNGTIIKLGTVADVVDKVYGRDAFKITLFDNERSYFWSFVGDRSAMSMAVDKVGVDGSSVDKPEFLRFLLPTDMDQTAEDFALRMQGLTYITAERIGPRELYPLLDSSLPSVVGPAGEYAVSILYAGRDEIVVGGLNDPAEPVPTLLKQVIARMRQFFPGCMLEVVNIPNSNTLRLGLRTSDDTDYHRPIHVGYGLTQVFPIIVAALSAKDGDILLIENPEVHLHPAGQALMGRFLSDVAGAGIQVILETHSDHVLNGIRRSVKAELLSPDQVAIHFFKPRSDTGPQVISPTIDRTGNIDNWPEGFFDQFDKDMNHFAGWDN